MSNKNRHHPYRTGTLGHELFNQRVNGEAEWLELGEEVVFLVQEFAFVFDKHEFTRALSQKARRSRYAITKLSSLSAWCADLTDTPRGEAAIRGFEAVRGFRPIVMLWDARFGAVLRIGANAYPITELLGEPGANKPSSP